MMIRVPDWHSRYVRFISEMRKTPFSWGDQDCGLSWVGRHIETITTGAEGIFDAYKGRYKTYRGAVKFFKELETDSLGDLAAKHLPEIHPSMATIGDIAAIADDSPFKHSFGIVNGEKIFVRREDGIGVVDLLNAERAFRV